MEAPRNLKLLGISGVVAESFGRIFFRNCISQGIPTLACKGITEFVEEDDVLQFDVQTGVMVNLTTGKKRTVNPLSAMVIHILEAGGVMAMLKKENHR